MSTVSFKDATKQGIAGASKTFRKGCSALVKEQHVRTANGAITEYQVNTMPTFIIDDWRPPSRAVPRADPPGGTWRYRPR